MVSNTPEENKAESPVTQQAVMDAISEACRRAHPRSVGELVRTFAPRLSEIPPERYQDLIDALGKLPTEEAADKAKRQAASANKVVSFPRPKVTPKARVQGLPLRPKNPAGGDDGDEIPNDGRVKAQHKVILKSAAGETATAIDWLWPGYLARGKFHILAGVAGSGKSTATFNLAATLTRGGQWPDGSQSPVGDVLIWSGEDGWNDTILPRFDIAGGDRSRLFHIKNVIANGQKRKFDPANDVYELTEAMRQHPNLRLVIIDPIVAMGGKESHRNAETRLALQAIVDLAEELGAAVIGITHFTKGTEGRDPLERVTGSLAYGALARIVLGAAKSDDENGPRRLVRAKSNIGPSGGGFEYLLRQVMVPGCEFFNQQVVWSTRLQGPARELLDSLNPKEPSQRGAAIMFLESTLKAAGNAGVAVKALKQAAEAHCISWRTVERAKAEELAGKIVAKQNSGSEQAGWYWVWTGPSEDDLPL